MNDNGCNGYFPFAKLLEMDIVTSPATTESRQTAQPSPEEDVLARLQAAIEAARAEKSAIERGEALAGELADLKRQIEQIQEELARLEAEHRRRAEPIEAALRAAEALGDLVDAEARAAAREALLALAEEYDGQTIVARQELERVQDRMAAIEDDSDYARWAERRQKAVSQAVEVARRRLEEARQANNSRRFDLAEELAAQVLGDDLVPDDLRDRANKFLDAVRYARQRYEERRAERRARKQRRKMARWFARVEEAAVEGDFLVSLGPGQFAHLRPEATRSGAEIYRVVSAFGYEAPEVYSTLPKRARRRPWREGFTPRPAVVDLAPDISRGDAGLPTMTPERIEAAWREAKAAEAVMRLRVTFGGSQPVEDSEMVAVYGEVFAEMLAASLDVRVEETPDETLAEVTRDEDSEAPIVVVTSRIRRNDPVEQRRLRAEKLARDVVKHPDFAALMS